METPSTAEATEQSESSTKEPKSPKTLVVLTVVSLCVALAAGGVAGYLWFQLNDLEDRTGRALSSIGSNVNAVESDVSILDSRVDALESDVGYVAGYQSLTDQIDDLVSAMSTAERDIGNLESSAGDSFTDDVLIDAISNLRECVNDYMVTVGNAGGGRYTYYTC